MFDNDVLEAILTAYKEDFKRSRGTEGFKWKAVKHFLTVWDVDAKDFPAMLRRSLTKANHLLDSGHFLPKSAILTMSEKEPESVREMFRRLFDESRPVLERIGEFIGCAKDLHEKHGGTSERKHHQTTNSISVYLFLRYPEKYFIFKFGKFKDFANKISYPASPEIGKVEEVENYFNMCDEVLQMIKQDSELVSMAKASLSDKDYPDRDLHILTEDVIMFGSKMTLTEGEGGRIGGPVSEVYTRDDFLKDVYMSENDYDSLVSLLTRKKNVILQGVPGVGKTFAAKRLAYALLGKMDASRVRLVQFHKSYSYEDFVAGCKPGAETETRQEGVFCQFCRQAEARPRHKFVLLIDEINRGDLGKIFGEMISLIEKNDRSEPMTLASGGEPFTVPPNLHIIGMMNTADPSLAIVDYALRRRFGFFDMRPAFDTVGFTAYQRSLKNALFDKLIAAVKDLNRAIAEDETLGSGYCIGHGYFCEGKANADKWVPEIIKYDLIPMIREYWFENKMAAAQWTARLNAVLSNI